jgi:hypothetical protein
LPRHPAFARTEEQTDPEQPDDPPRARHDRMILPGRALT